MSAEETVRRYKQLTQVERAFRSFKTMDLEIRPIHRRFESRVLAHIFVCMLAYYVLWHMFKAWRLLLFGDEDQQLRRRVTPSRRRHGPRRRCTRPTPRPSTTAARSIVSIRCSRSSAASYATSVASRAHLFPMRPRLMSSHDTHRQTKTRLPVAGGHHGVGRGIHPVFNLSPTDCSGSRLL